MKTPTLRILGLFRTQEEAVSYGTNTVYPQYNHCDLRVGETNKWHVLARSNEKMLSESHCSEQIGTLLRLHLASLKENQEEFLKNVHERTMGKTGHSVEARKKKIKKDKKKSRGKGRAAALAHLAKQPGPGPDQSDNQAKKGKNENNDSISCTQIESSSAKSRKSLPVYPAGLTLRSQAFATISFVCDGREPVIKGEQDPEPIFLVYSEYDTEERARKHSKYLGEHVREFAVDVVDMYEPLGLEMVDTEKIQTDYRHPELQLIMDARKAEPEKVASFERRAKQLGKEYPSTTITPEMPDAKEIIFPGNMPVNVSVKESKDSEWKHVTSSDSGI